MFRTVFLVFAILHLKFSASVPPIDNVAVQSEGPAQPHPYLTGAKFIPYKTARSEDVTKREPFPSFNTLSASIQQSSGTNLQDQSTLLRVQNILPINSLPTEILDKFSRLPPLETRQLPFTKESSPSAASNVRNSANSLPLAVVQVADNSNAAKLAAAVKLSPINVAELANNVASDSAKFIPSANVLPISVGGLKNVVENSAPPLISAAFSAPTSAGELKSPQYDVRLSQVSQPNADLILKNSLPFPNVGFDPKLVVSRKLVAPEPVYFDTEESEPGLSKRITLPRESPAVEASQPTNAISSPTNTPSDGKLIAIPPSRLPTTAGILPVKFIPPKEEKLTELVNTLSTNGYGILASQMAAVLNVSTVKDDLPLIFQRLSDPRKSKDHSPKTDVEVFAPLTPEQPAQPPIPDIPINPAQYPFSPGNPNYPSDQGPPFVFNEYPAAYPPFLPEQPGIEKPFIPHFPALLPTMRATEETTRPTEDTTRATEETTPKSPKTTPTVPKVTPWVPKNIPFVPKNTPSAPKNTPLAPKNTPPRQPDYTQDDSGHSWITRFYPGYPPTTKQPKGMPSPIWPKITPQPVKIPEGSKPSDMVTPFMEKLISATSTAATPSVQIIGEPSPVDPKYKLAVVSDYKNYDPNDGTFGFSIDLENGVTAKVRGYKKEGKHFIEGSYSLFANEGDPVNITYIADNEPPDIKPASDVQQTTLTESAPSPIDESIVPPTEA